MSTIRKLISAWTLALVGGLLLPLMSVAAISSTTCFDAPHTTTTAPVVIAEYTASVKTVDCGSTGLQSMASGQMHSLLGLSRNLNAPEKPTRQFTVQKKSKKVALEETRHAHGGKPKPTPPGMNKKQMKQHVKKQNHPESHPNSAHPEKHFHRSDKQKHIRKTSQNPHVTYPKGQ